MKAVLLALCAWCFLWNAASAEESGASAADRMAAQLANPKVPVSDKVLEELAVLTYRMATAVPEKGLEASRAELEGLIAFRKQLETYPGVAENLLARQIQEVVDSSVLFEIVREHADATKTDLIASEQDLLVQPPFKAGSLKPETVRALLDQNRVDERARVEFVLNGDSRLAEEFRKSRVTPEEVLDGKWEDKLPAEAKQSFTPIRQEDFPREPGLPALKDYLLAATFLEIDRARDTRLIGGLYLKNNRLPVTWTLLHSAIEEQLKANPVWRVAEAGIGNASLAMGTLSRTGDLAKRHNGETRPKRLLFWLSPFVPNPDLFGPLGKEFSSFAPRMAGLFLRERQFVPTSKPIDPGAESPKAPKSSIKP